MSIVPVVTAGGTEATQPAHGTGMPTFTVQTQMDGNVKIGELLTITFGSMGTPTLADAEAGYQFDFTYIRNPYANAGLPIPNVQLLILVIIFSALLSLPTCLLASLLPALPAFQSLR